LITKRLSPVVYILQVDGFATNVHATNMKPFIGRKTVNTPYVEPGFTIYQANENVVPEPLLLSPDSSLNEETRFRFKKKNISHRKAYSEGVNARISREQRGQEMKEMLSMSQESIVIDDDLTFGDQDMSTQSHNGSSASNNEEDNDEEANATEIRSDEEPTTPQWEFDFRRKTRIGLANWDRISEIKKVRFSDQNHLPSSIKHRHNNNPSTSTQPTKVHAYGQRDVHSFTKPMDHLFRTPNTLPTRPKRSSRPSKHSRRPKNKTRQIEDCNLAGGEKWEQHFGNTLVDLIQDGDDSDQDSVVDSTSSEDSFDREQWHRSVLKACTNHASKLNLSAYEPIMFGFENIASHKLRVELDGEIRIPIEFRRLWYQLHLDIRHFGKTGLLFPISNPILDSRDHWRNNSKHHVRHVPLNIYLRILTIPASVMKTLFHPLCKGKITLSTDPENTRTILLGNHVEIQHKYDMWYWNAMRVARRMDIDPSSPRRAYSKLRGHGRKEGIAMNGPEWRAHHFYMWNAIKRNQTLREPPLWYKETVPRC
jgi:hypothetical protein